MRTNIFNCKIHISFPLIVILTLSTIWDKSGITVLGFVATIIHELGHILAMKYKNYEIKEIHLSLFNFNIVDYNRNEKNFNDDIFILASGPLLNLICASIFFTLFQLIPQKFLFYFFLENLLIAIVNLLPIASLDGGQILYIILSIKYNEKKAYYILNIISIAFLFPIAIISFLVLLKSRYNFSLLWIVIYLITLLITKKSEYI